MSRYGQAGGGSGRAPAPYESVERALGLSRADACVVIAEEHSTVHLRWARNTLTTNGVTRARTVTVIAVFGGARGAACGVVSRNAATPEELEDLVRAAEAAARAAGPAEDAVPLVEGVPPDPRFTAPPVVTSPSVFGTLAPALGRAFARAGARGRELYGYARHSVLSTYLGTSTGLRLRHDQPSGTFTLNAKAPAPDGTTASAWSGHSTRDFTELTEERLQALDDQLARRLEWSRRRVELPAGRYETLLPPTAVADLLVYQTWSSSARNAAEGRTVFSAERGGTRVGERLTRLPLTLRSDPWAPGLESAPFLVAYASGGEAPSGGGPGGAPASVFDNGLPLAPTEWIREGTLTRLLTSRHSAALTGLPLAPAAGNLLLECADDGRPAASLEAPSLEAPSLEDMVAGTERGLLLTSLWYVREVDPASLLLTGLTRDGVHLVENGEVTGTVNNFRFNESPVDLLARATEAGRAERTLSREWAEWFPLTSMPPLRVPDFNMSSVSRGV
ncbi:MULTISPECIES: metallopeptidase TldD-related protein [unclassified Streptomyces]|uniref:metallopeptidase TldD-related protein n=1 Tax=unclassified Streptomyces TaxID=2593676 RepID=UPI002DDAB084|nr:MULTISPECIES: metallopeptidase TldD-related protein [unclassified Streptomyces]WSA95690.1 metallopeptidase TldD-related protein [Streptomyces sp. NBC_01795]WSB80110.1 metallopeptidase TldD-related protein [Streptomyces sp. NBC_01775]WSS11683.1 metallopeptidase TldD-related protein [Streptomyces sp. NBC_01186]WSS40396.1 metallopeptidase TldD-related protein [Streptomyces sp. NBC_01187]